MHKLIATIFAVALIPPISTAAQVHSPFASVADATGRPTVSEQAMGHALMLVKSGNGLDSQVAAGSPRATDWDSLVEGSQVRFTLVSGERVSGRLVEVGQSSVTLRVPSANKAPGPGQTATGVMTFQPRPRVLQRSDVTSIDIPVAAESNWLAKHPVTSGTLIGSAVFGLLGAASYSTSNNNFLPREGNLAVAAATGAGFGALVGWIISAAAD
jgi:hypothetical protein